MQGNQCRQESPQRTHVPLRHRYWKAPLPNSPKRCTQRKLLHITLNILAFWTIIHDCFGNLESNLAKRCLLPRPAPELVPRSVRELLVLVCQETRAIRWTSHASAKGTVNAVLANISKMFFLEKLELEALFLTTTLASLQNHPQKKLMGKTRTILHWCCSPDRYKLRLYYQLTQLYRNVRWTSNTLESCEAV